LSKCLYKYLQKDFEDFTDFYYSFINHEEETIAAVLTLAEAGMLKEFIRLQFSNLNSN